LAATESLVIFLAEGGTVASASLPDLHPALSEFLKLGDFTGKSEQTSVLYPQGQPVRRVILVGLGASDSLSAEILRRAAAVALKKARELKSTQVSALLPAGFAATDAAQAITEGALMGLYSYRGQKSQPDTITPVQSLSLFVASQDVEAVSAAVKIGEALANASILARDLANLPPNICTPAYLAQAAHDMATRTGLRCEILERGQMLALRMGALLAVAQGSDNAPRFIILEHNPGAVSDAPLVLVGKGVSFDTGGYTIKTGEGMVGMKADMSGAAAVIGAMQAIATLNVPRRVVALIPTVENMIDGTAYRPQDVLTASNGKTIEVISTDAEGRLILADALVYASRFAPAAVVDIATLTGSISVALGAAYGGLYATTDHLRDALLSAGERTHERVWPMPLSSDYRKLIDTDTADMKNTGGRAGGANIAAIFLKEFVDYPAWAHIDMAGVMLDQSGNPTVPAKGSSGYGARLLTEFVRGWIAS
jgi:leucyl aminopeptidase